MNKASEWAAQGGAWRQNRPSFEGETLRAHVTDDGRAVVRVRYPEFHDPQPADADELLALARWIRDTFGELGSA